MKSQVCWRTAIQIAYNQKSAKENAKEKDIHEYFPMVICPRQAFLQASSNIQNMNSEKKLLAVKAIFT